MIKISTFGIATILWASLAQAVDRPRFDLQMKNEFISGYISDGTRIGQGVITYLPEHNGFQVWNDVAQYGGQPNHYVLAGGSGNGNTLRVRIENNDWLPDNEGGRGIILHASADSAVFYIVIDGDQQVKADSYSIELKGATLSP